MWWVVAQNDVQIDYLIFSGIANALQCFYQKDIHFGLSIDLNS